jgi:hypothetical protein
MTQVMNKKMSSPTEVGESFILMLDTVCVWATLYKVFAHFLTNNQVTKDFLKERNKCPAAV